MTRVPPGKLEIRGRISHVCLRSIPPPDSNQPWNAMLGIFLVKSIIWAIALGSGTSGGVLAPLLMIGGALGGLASGFLPFQGAGFWELVSMGSVLAGTIRAPMTAVIFSLELTHDVNILLPLLIGSIIAHGFTTLLLPRSILTEKVSRRGYHISAEYAVDPLETLFVKDVMRLDGTESMEPAPAVVAYPDETLRAVAARMAETGRMRVPVVARAAPATPLGYIAFDDLLKARLRRLDEERRRERLLGGRRRRPTTSE
jgi:CIC family chloride channel protein